MCIKKANLSAKAKKDDDSGLYYKPFIHLLILSIGTILLYGWTFTFAYGLDDELVINYLDKFENTYDGFLLIFQKWYGVSDYRPFTIVSFWLERKWYGSINPGISHLINIYLLLFLLFSIYRFIVISKFFEDKKQLYVFAFLSCIIFLVHPNHVSVVANIKSRDNLLSMLFGILACSELIKAYDFKQYWRVFLFLILMTIALLSKLDAYVLIIIPLLVIVIYRKLSVKKIILGLAITFVLYTLLFEIRSLFMTGLNKAEFVSATLSDAGNPLFGHETLINKISMTLTSLYYYLKFLFIPFGYYFYFGAKQIELSQLFSLINIVSLISVIALICLSIYRYKKNRIYLFSLLFFLLSIAYALNFFITVSGVVADRYNFIASLGFCMAVSSLFIEFAKEQSLYYYKNISLYILLLIFISFTVYRTSAWRNQFTLFDRDLKHLTKSINANRIAAGTYINFALDEQETNKNYDKNYTDSLITLAEKQLYVAMKVSDKNSRIWEHLGICALYRNNDSIALNMLRKSYQLDTSNMNGTNYLGFAFWRLNQLDSAIYYFNYVINKENEFGYSANNLINLYSRNNQISEADSVIHILLNRYPNDRKLLNKIEELNSLK